MRCINCGFDNAPGKQVCVKCGTTLSSDEPFNSKPFYASNYHEEESEDTKPTVVYSSKFEGAPLKKTVAQMSDGFLNESKDSELRETVVQVQPNQLGLCPRCSRPLSDGFCPNCGYDTNGDASSNIIDHDIRKTHNDKINIPYVKCVKCKKEVPANYVYCPYCAEPIPQPTIDIFSHKDAFSFAEEKVVPRRFSLTPVISEGDSPQEPRIFDLLENKYILNRDNTSPGNRTITSKEQAEICFSDDKWLLENRSEYDSTFVAATRPIEIQPGDIILIGDQRFRFMPIDTAE